MLDRGRSQELRLAQGVSTSGSPSLIPREIPTKNRCRSTLLKPRLRARLLLHHHRHQQIHHHRQIRRPRHLRRRVQLPATTAEATETSFRICKRQAAGTNTDKGLPALWTVRLLHVTET